MGQELIKRTLLADRNRRRNVNDATSISHTITRVLLISPEQNELLRRNRSRIFIYPHGESLIDALIFQSCRRLEDFIPDVQRAIEMAQLEDASNASQLMVIDSPNITGGMMQKHIVSNGWLKIDHTVYDMVLEVAINGEVLPSPDITTMSIDESSDNAHENPLIILTGVESFAEGYYGRDGDEPDNVVELTPRAQADTPSEQQEDAPKRRVARQTQEVDQEDESGRMAGRPGRVKNPLLDGRLKGNRIARRSQEGDGPSGASKGKARATA
jgi:hypothetical protein